MTQSPLQVHLLHIAALRTSELSQIDILVHNAGVCHRGVFTEEPLQYGEEVLSLNVQAAMDLTHLVVPGMVARGRGRVLFVSSIAGKITDTAACSVLEGGRLFMSKIWLSVCGGGLSEFHMYRRT